MCLRVYVCVSEEKTRKERNHIFDFLLDTRFIILLLFLWQNFICRARRGDVKAFSVRFYRRLLVCGCQKYDNVDGSRRGVVNSFILYLFSTLSCENKFRVFKSLVSLVLWVHERWSLPHLTIFEFSSKIGIIFLYLQPTLPSCSVSNTISVA